MGNISINVDSSADGGVEDDTGLGGTGLAASAHCTKLVAAMTTRTRKTTTRNQSRWR